MSKDVNGNILCLHDKPFKYTTCLGRNVKFYMHVTMVLKILMYNCIYFRIFHCKTTKGERFFECRENIEDVENFQKYSYLFTYYFSCTMSPLLLKNVLKPFLIFLSTFLISAFDHIFKVTFPHFKIQRNYFCIRTNLKGGRKISYVFLKT